MMQSALMLFSPQHGIPYFAASRYQADDFRRGHPRAVWAFDPWTGRQRDQADTEIDPWGLLIVPATQIGADRLPLPDPLALHRLAKDLLDPERHGHTVTREIRNQARHALGIVSLE